MADTTVSATGGGATTNPGHLGGDTAAALANQANKAPAAQKGYDPKDPKWATFPGHAARLNGWPRADGQGRGSSNSGLPNQSGAR